jgi:hypothetical protein
MTALVDPPLNISYEGPGSGTELLGAVQANFFIDQSDREVAVLVNTPALEFLAGEMGVQADDAWNERAAAVIGEAVVRDQHTEGGRIEALTFVGKSVFDEIPGLLDHVKRVLA